MAVLSALLCLLTLAIGALGEIPCPVSNPVHIKYYQTVSQAVIDNSGDSSECGNKLSSECFLWEENEFTYSSLDGAFSNISLLMETSSLTGFELTLGQSNSTTDLKISECYHIHHLDHVTITGLGVVTVDCANNAGLVFNATVSVTMQAISWWGCGPMIINIDDVQYATVQSGLAFIDCDQVILNVTEFHNFQGSAVLFNIRNQPHYRYEKNSCPAAENQSDVSYIVQDCSFFGNGKTNASHDNDGMVELGGALSILIGTSRPNQILITNTTFDSNQAKYGGGIFYNRTDHLAHSLCIHSQFVVRDSSFIHNRAESRGGAVLIISQEAQFSGCMFDSNSAVSIGGAIAYTLLNSVPAHTSLSHNTVLLFQSCTWSNNTAKGSAAFYLKAVSVTTPVEIAFINCNFSRNWVSHLYFFDQSACIMYLVSVDVVFRDLEVTDNYGTMFGLHSSTIDMQGHGSFHRNQGYDGGCVFLYTSSAIDLNPGLVLEFINNTALYGGVVYQAVLLPNDDDCIFKLPSNGTEVTQSQVHVYFKDNHAFISGHSIFLVSATPTCERVFERPEFTFSPNETNQLSSSAEKIKFLPPSVVNNSNGMPQLNVTLGWKIEFTALVLDFWNNSVLTQVSVFLQFPDKSRPPPYNIIGPTFTIQNGTNNPNLFITGPKITKEGLPPLNLVLASANLEEPLDIYFLPCPLGFEYDEASEQCICYDEDDIACDMENGTVCIADSYWLGLENGTYIMALCSFGFCSTSYGVCEECPIDAANSYCLVTGINSECLYNRAGILCSTCEEGFSPTFQAIHCVSNSTCTPQDTFYVLAINAGSVAFVIFLFIVILKLDYRIGSGHLVGVFYYYSIVGHLLVPNIVKEPLLIIVAILKGITQLNPQLLGYLDLCFSDQVSIVLQYVMVYLNPFIVAVIMLALVEIAKRFPRVLKFNDSTPVRAICLLITSSFATLTETSFSIISGVELEGVNQTRVNIQPSLHYLDTKQHLPWFVLAVLILVLLILPFTILLLLAPLLMRCFNLTRIKPFLDEFQGCYKDKFRWMAGFYFLCRIVYLAIKTSSRAGQKFIQYIIQFLSLAILLVHAILQPYENHFLNLVDSVILANLTIVTLFFGETVDYIFHSVRNIRLMFLGILILIPVLYLLFLATTAGAMKFHLHKSNGRKLFLLCFSKFKADKTTGDTAQNQRTSSFSSSYNLLDYREPLLPFVASPDRKQPSSPSTLDELPSFQDEPKILFSQTVIDLPLLSMVQDDESKSMTDEV